MKIPIIVFILFIILKPTNAQDTSIPFSFLYSKRVLRDIGKVDVLRLKGDTTLALSRLILKPFHEEKNNSPIRKGEISIIQVLQGNPLPPVIHIFKTSLISSTLDTTPGTVDDKYDPLTNQVFFGIVAITNPDATGHIFRMPVPKLVMSEFWFDAFKKTGRDNLNAEFKSYSLLNLDEEGVASYLSSHVSDPWLSILVIKDCIQRDIISNMSALKAIERLYTSKDMLNEIDFIVVDNNSNPLASELLSTFQQELDNSSNLSNDRLISISEIVNADYDPWNSQIKKLSKTIDLLAVGPRKNDPLIKVMVQED